jgi:DNA polymerase V
MTRGGIRKGAGRPRGQGKFGEETKPVRVPISMLTEVSDFLKTKGFSLPLYSSSVSAGSPSPADDYIESKLDLNQFLIKHPTSTFFVKVIGDSMINAGIGEGDILVVDRSLEPKPGKIVIASLDGQLTVKRLGKIEEQLFLLPENNQYKPIPIEEGNELIIWGVVTSLVRADL